MSMLTGRSPSAGTLTYMSPEQLESRAVDARSDIYGLGITLFELLKGEPPFVEGDITHCHLTRAVPLIEGVSQTMNDVIQKATAKKPDDRYQSCKEMKAALSGKVVKPARKKKKGGGILRKMAFLGTVAGCLAMGIVGIYILVVSTFSDPINPTLPSVSTPTPTPAPQVTPPQPTPPPGVTTSTPTVANEPPSVQFTTISNKEIPRKEMEAYVFRFRGADLEFQLDSFKWRLDGGNWTDLPGSETQISLRSTSRRPPLALGEHTLEIQAFDIKGAGSEIAQCKFTLERDKPEVDWDTEPRSSVQGSQTVFVEGTSDQEGSIVAYRFALDGVRYLADPNVYTEVRAPANSFTIQGLTESTHVLYAQAVDEKGAVSEPLKSGFRYNPSSLRSASTSRGSSSSRYYKPSSLVFVSVVLQAHALNALERRFQTALHGADSGRRVPVGRRERQRRGNKCPDGYSEDFLDVRS